MDMSLEDEVVDTQRESSTSRGCETTPSPDTENPSAPTGLGIFQASSEEEDEPTSDPSTPTRDTKQETPHLYGDRDRANKEPVNESWSSSTRYLSPLKMSAVSQAGGYDEPQPTAGTNNRHKGGTVPPTLYDLDVLNLEAALKRCQQDPGPGPAAQSRRSMQSIRRAVDAISVDLETTVADAFSKANKGGDECRADCPFQKLASKLYADLKTTLHHFETVSNALPTKPVPNRVADTGSGTLMPNSPAIPQASPEEEELFERMQAQLEKSRSPTVRDSTMSFSDGSNEAPEVPKGKAASWKRRDDAATAHVSSKLEPTDSSESSGEPEAPSFERDGSAFGPVPEATRASDCFKAPEAGRTGRERETDKGWDKQTWDNPSWTVDGVLDEHVDFSLPGSEATGPQAASNSGTSRRSRVSTKRQSISSIAGELRRTGRQPWTLFQEQEEGKGERGEEGTADVKPEEGSSWYNREENITYKTMKGVVWQGREVDAPEYWIPDWRDRPRHPWDINGYSYVEAQEAWYKEGPYGWFEIRKAPPDVETPEMWETGRREEESLGAWFKSALLHLLLAVRLPWMMVCDLYRAVDSSAALQAAIRLTKLLVLLHNIQTYVANKRERRTWLDANDLTRVHMLQFMRRDPFALAPGIDYSHGLGWADATTVALFLVHLYDTCSRAVLVAAAQAKMSAASWSYFASVVCETAWADTACLTLSVLWQVLTSWVKDALTLPFQAWGFVSRENAIVIDGIYKFVVDAIGYLIGWRYYWEQPRWGLFPTLTVDVEGWMEFLYSVAGWPWNVWSSHD